MATIEITKSQANAMAALFRARWSELYGIKCRQKRDFGADFEDEALEEEMREARDIADRASVIARSE